jgi:DNA-directed RNA polymerase specialized sigma24 family protein
MKRHHPKIKFQPQWRGPIEGYTINTLRRYYPKLMATHEFEDLLQEARIKFLVCQRAYCRKAYKGGGGNAAWFMAYYKCSLINHLNTLVMRNSRYNFLEYSDPVLLIEPLLAEDNEIDVLRVLANLPTEFAEVLMLLANGVKKGVSVKKVEALHHYLVQEMGA